MGNLGNDLNNGGFRTTHWAADIILLVLQVDFTGFVVNHIISQVTGMFGVQ